MTTQIHHRTVAYNAIKNRNLPPSLCVSIAEGAPNIRELSLFSEHKKLFILPLTLAEIVSVHELPYRNMAKNEMPTITKTIKLTSFLFSSNMI